MSERQARKQRKMEPEKVIVKKRSKADIISNIIIVILILAVLGIGSWAVWSKYSEQAKSNEQIEQTIPTVEEYAKSLEMTTEEFLAEYGLSGNENIKSDTDITYAINYMTLENYSKMVKIDVETMKTNLGAKEDVTGETLVGDIIASVQSEAENKDAQ